MRFKPIITQEVLFLGLPIEIQITDSKNPLKIIKCVKLRQPTLELIYGDSRFNTFVAILDGKLGESKINIPFLQDLTNSYELLKAAATVKSQETSFFLDIIKHGLSCLGLELKPSLDFYELNGIPLLEEYFVAVVDSILISMDLKGVNVLNETPREKEMRLRIEKIKKTGKSANDQKGSGYLNLEKNFITLKYEFGLSKQEILDLTVHAQKAILSYTSGSVNYKTSVVAFASGNAKKIKFITDKEK